MRNIFKLKVKIFCSLLLVVLSLINFAYAGGNFKWISVGKIRNKVMDWGPQLGNYWQDLWYYYDNFEQWNQWFSVWGIGVANWTDEEGNFHHTFDDVESEDGLGTYIFAVEYEPGLTIKRYFRYRPPEIVVDGMHIEEPFPQFGDEVAPEKILGTADVMVESHIRTYIGVDIYQRAYGWSQTNHDDYILYEWTLVNTGNTDLDDEIELPGQVLDSLYFGMNLEANPNVGPNHAWHSKVGELIGDPLRMLYAYPSRNPTTPYDDYANPDYTTGFPQDPEWIGLLTVHADRSSKDHRDDPAQPQMTANLNPWQTCVSRWGSYTRMALGFKPDLNIPYMQELGYDVYPNTHHHPRMDDTDYWGVRFPITYRWFKWIIASTESFGPYHLDFGDSIKIVWANVVGSIDPKTGWKIGKAWKRGVCDSLWEGEYYLPPAWKYYTNLTDNDKARDSWITTGKDSLFQNAKNAIWAWKHKLNVPIPPPPPSIYVESRPDYILVKWGNESESAPDFAGYRVYRAQGSTYYTESEGVVKGDWKLIFECGEGTQNELTHEYEDHTAERGKSYFYAVTAFDDGSHPEVPDSCRGDVFGIQRSLGSSIFLNMTFQPAYLTRPAGKSLDDIRIVPNPWNISAQQYQYPGQPYKIMFLNLPPICTIRIFNESGDLIKKIEHTDGSGDEAWEDPTGQYFMVTDEQQVPVSGLYIANITTPDGKSKNLTFYIIR